MKKYIDIKGNQIEGEMTVDRMFDISLKTLEYRIEHGQVDSDPRIKKLLKESVRNRKEIVKVIKESESHYLGNDNDFNEIHCIALVDGKAHCLKSIGFDMEGESGVDKILFVYEKTYNRYNYNDFQTDFYRDGGLDSVWFDFNFKKVA